MNYISTEKAPKAIGPYSQGVVVYGVLYTSGQIAINPETNNIEEQYIEGQTIQVMENLKAICQKAGTSLDNTIKTTCFLADISNFEVFNKIYEKYFINKPARSCVAVKDLPKGALVEVEIIAKVDRK